MIATVRAAHTRAIFSVRWTRSIPRHPRLPPAAATAAPAVRPVVLLILDGFGCREDAPDNAITRANTPQLARSSSRRARTRRSTPRSCASACPKGRWAIRRWATSTSAPAASSTRTSRASTSRSATASSRAIRCSRAPSTPRARGNATLHVLGLLSPGGVHSHERQHRGDGRHGGGRPALPRDRACTRFSTAATRRRAAPARRSRSWSGVCARHADARIASICGRYYAMDRDQRWERIAAGLRAARRRPRAAHVAPERAGRARRRVRARRERRIRAGDGDRRRARRGRRGCRTATSSCS